MENQRNSTNKGIDSDGAPLSRGLFKTPAGYTKIRKQIIGQSKLLPLASFLGEKARLSKSIVDFCKQLLAYEDFSSFRTVHFFKHEKGQSFALKYEISASTHSAKTFHVNEFNQLYQAIKKSKNRTFGQESLKGFNFDILGTFLAREFALGNHNIILIVSRNDFLPQSKEEKQAFSKVMKVIAPCFNVILDKELETQHLEHATLAFENLPYKVGIFSKEELPGGSRLPSGKVFKLEMEESLDQADIFHQERIALLGELLNTLKHELSNPLFGLQLSAELLCQELKDKEHIQFMREISSSIKRSQSIISNFTELYTSSERISSDDLEKMAHEVFTLTKSQSRHIKKTYTAIEGEQQDFVISANSVWLAQILFNLVVNSAQALNQTHTQNPSIEVKAFLKDPFELHVTDNGPGPDVQTAENMFKPFYTTKEKGTGLGLAISQSLARKLNGKIEYIPEGQGAHFVLKLRS